MSTAVQRSRAARRSVRRMPSPLREGMPALGRRLAEVFLFFFLCLSECFRLPSPFAACAVSAYLLHKNRLLFPAAGIALSLCLRLIWGTAADLWQYVGLALLLALRFRPPRAVWMASAYTACALSLRLAALALAPATQEETILCLLSLVTGVLCTPAVCHAVGLARQARARLRIDDLLCCVVLCMLTLSGAGRVAVGAVNVGFLLSGLLVLVCAAAGGCAAAVAAGILSGVSLALCGHANGYVVCYAFSGIVCGLFYGRKRGALCLIHLLCAVFTSYAIRFRADVPFLVTAGLSCLVFLLLPRRTVTAAFTLMRRLSPDDADNEAAYAQLTRAQWIGSIDALSRLLPEVRLSQPDTQEQVEDAMARLCEGCERLPACWQERREETKALFSRYFTENDVTARMEDCPRREAWPALALEAERTRAQFALRCAYAQREREAARTHLSAIAQAMQNLSRAGGQGDRGDEQLRGEAEFLLRQMRVAGKVVYALRVSQHIRVALRYEAQLTGQRQLERYGEALSMTLCVPLHISQRSKDMILYEETPPLSAECYQISVAAGDGKSANGDAALMRALPGGVELTMLSDGMGHGDRAHDESEKTLELLSLCLDAGYSVPDALDAINCIMLSSTDGEQYATVDLCAANLWQGTARLYKLGACPSLLISGSSLRVLESGALPLGILPQVASAAHAFSFAEGDMLLQFTDGLTDAIGGLRALEQQAELLTRGGLRPSPEAVCDALVTAAMRRSGGVPKDDMTVLCTLFRKTTPKKREKPSRSA